MKVRIFIILLFFIPLSYAENITIAITGNNPPFNSKIDRHNHFYGFDVELMDKICKELAATCKYTPMLFTDLFLALEHNKADLAIDSIIITPQHQKNYLFSQSYLTSRVRFLVNLSSRFASVDSLKHKRIAIRANNGFDLLLTDFFKGPDQVQIKPYNNIPDMIQALTNNEVDALLINNIAAEYWAANNDSLFKLLGTPILFGNGYGIMAKITNASLIARINTALQKMEADGSYKKLYSDYFAW